MKTVQPTHLVGGDTVHFLWRMPQEAMNDAHAHAEVLSGLARSLVTLGWGVDLVACSAALLPAAEADKLGGERWLPSTPGRAGWRVPVPGTLDALINRHRRFLERIGSDGTFTAPPPLGVFRVIGYRRSTDPVEPTFAAFALRDVETDRYRSFDAARHGLSLVGRMRHATYQAARASRPADWSDAELAAFVLGHGEAKGEAHRPAGARRFAYVSLPSIESRGELGERAGSIRRVLVSVSSEDCEAEIRWARQALSGQALIAQDTRATVALLEAIPATDRMVQRYVRPAESWATVTPVVLPGHDDPRHFRRRLRSAPPADEQKQLLARLSDRIDGLLRRSIVQAGLPHALAEHAEIEWRRVAFWPGVEPADRYGLPDHLKRFPRYHVRIEWRDVNGRPTRVPGPLCIGGGRFLGLGLFAPCTGA